MVMGEESVRKHLYKPPRGRGKFLGKCADKPNTPNNYELDWSMQWHTTG